MSEHEEVTAEAEETQAGEAAEKAEDTFKSEHSKQSVLADLAKERDERKALQARLDEIETANLSELEKAQKVASETQAQLAALTQENLRNSVALSKGVPADLVPFLTGDTEEALGTQADTLLARLNAPTTPKPDPTQGSKAAAASGSGDWLRDQFANN